MKLSILLTVLPILAVSSAAPAQESSKSISSSKIQNGTSTSSSRISTSTVITSSRVSSITSAKSSALSNGSSKVISTSKAPSSSSSSKSSSASTFKSSSSTSTIKASTSTAKTSNSSSSIKPASSSISSSKLASVSTSSTKPTSSSVGNTLKSTATSTSTSSAAQTTSSSSSAVGLGLSSASYSKLTTTKGLGWYYNWSPSGFSGMSSEFVPMIWGEGSIDPWDGTVPSGSSHILGFNEPDQSWQVGGSDMNVTYAATLHQKWTNKLKDKTVKIGSPAVARGGEWWFNGWITACNGQCKFDFVPIHFYGTNANDLITYIKSFPSQSKPIWLTEVACLDFLSGQICTLDQNKQFMQTAITWFRSTEGQKYIQRWSWFGAFPDQYDKPYGLENQDSTLNDLGKYYLSI
ncbi:hypothetical protein I204_01392 [Kwoniella mangroviensis CBS 8886]|nr:hypothetical protein I204_01392 [Kwoniella mangroviensis CBS 8886]